MKMFVRYGIAAIAAWFICLSARAGTIVDLRLVPDGSADPPGDRIDVSLLFAPGETKGTCEVRAYIIGEGKHEVWPVRSHNKADADNSGFFLVTQQVARRDGGTTGLQIVVPYGDLDLTPGTYKIGYEVTISGLGVLPIIRATQATMLVVTDQTRTHMTVPVFRLQSIPETEKQSAIVGLKPSAKTTKLDKQNFGLAVRRTKTVLESKDATVSIPGEFQRRALPKAAMRENDSAYARRDKLADSPTAWEPLSDVEDAKDRTVYFATNRARAPGSVTGATAQFSAEASDRLTVGKCVVNIPIQHRRGNLEQPGWWDPVDPAKHFLVESMQIVPQDDLFKEATTQDLLLYVHGFNTDFDFAVLRAAQLKYDLQFPGAVMAFSWPSAADAEKYQQDRQRVEQSVEQLADVLQGLLAGLNKHAPGASRPKLHILAHSLGNDLLLRAISELHLRGALPENSVVFGQVVLAAPDVGALEFNNLLPYVLEHSNRVTYYYCTHDAALGVSRNLNLYEPVGLMAFFQKGLDTINTDEVDTSFLFHGYYASARQVLSDVQLLLAQQRPPDERIPPLGNSSTVLGHLLWSFPSPQIAATANATAAKP